MCGKVTAGAAVTTWHSRPAASTCSIALAAMAIVFVRDLSSRCSSDVLNISISTIGSGNMDAGHGDGTYEQPFVCPRSRRFKKVTTWTRGEKSGLAVVDADTEKLDVVLDALPGPV